MTTMPAQRPGSSRQDYETPWEFIHAVEKKYGPLSIDISGSPENKKAPLVITKEMDALAYGWFGLPGNLWCNPEYRLIPKFLQKAVNDGMDRRTYLLHFLIPASVSTNYFADLIHDRAMVEPIRPRLHFVGMEEPYPKDLMLVSYGHGRSGFEPWRWK